MNVARLIEHHAEQRGNRIALRDSTLHFTYQELREASARLGTTLRSMGIGAGDPIAVVAENSAAMMLLYAATSRIGAIFAPINFRLTYREIEQLEGLLQPALFVVDNIHADRIESTTVTLDELIARSQDTRPIDEVVSTEASDSNMILFTSGTTGLPKGATLTHGNILANCANVAYHQSMTTTDVTYVVLPLYHTAGLHLQVTPAWYMGAEVVVAESWNVDCAARVLSSGEITTLFLLPEQWRDVTDVLHGRRLYLREPVTGGSRVPEQTIDNIERIFGGPPSFIMGMTEVSPQINYMPGRDMRCKNGSVGRPTLWADICIVDDDLRQVEQGDVGEMCIRGPLVLREYWRAPDKTAGSFDRFGYFHGGDLVIQDEEGFITIVDRKKDMIRSGGENVFSVEVEQILQRHPAVREVSVVGIPHERWGEGVAAVIVAEPGTTVTLAELQEFCKQYIASYKKPIHLEIVDELPRNPTGKVLKPELRRWLQDRSHTEEGNTRRD